MVDMVDQRGIQGSQERKVGNCTSLYSADEVLSKVAGERDKGKRDGTKGMYISPTNLTLTGQIDEKSWQRCLS